MFSLAFYPTGKQARFDPRRLRLYTFPDNQRANGDMDMPARRRLEQESPEHPIQRYRVVRGQSEALCRPLAVDDYQVQSITETSPPKWHLAHVTWFFETFLLEPFLSGYRPYHDRFRYLFNSYYETVGPMQPRPQRGLLSRPTVEEVYRYRAHVDEYIEALLDTVAGRERAEVLARLTLGLNHEQQHQELLLMDIKHNFSVNPLLPAYQATGPGSAVSAAAAPDWIEVAGGIRDIGHGGAGFAFDNEGPRHRVLVRDHRLATRLVTNGEYLAFMEDGGYERPELWLSDGWSLIRRRGWRHPLYWHRDGERWSEFTLGGPGPLDPDMPVSHVSYYEADAFARWTGRRLPEEAELELQLADRPVEGNFADSGRLHPRPGCGQWYGDLWEWTASPYGPYPGFRPLGGAMGEYNGKFMCNQMVLRGGCCATPRDHMRPTYRNFFYPHDRWPFTGIRLAEEIS